MSAVFKDPSPSRDRSPYHRQAKSKAPTSQPSDVAGPGDGARLAPPGEMPCAPGDRVCLRGVASRFPRDPGVYVWRDGAGTPIYVGKARDLRARVRSYLSGPQDTKTQALVADAAGVDFIVTHTEKEALILEQTLIKRERPRYNVRLTDDKKYPYIKVTDEEFPRVVYTRDLTRSGTYFGPFPDALAAKNITRLLNRTFQLRQCRTLPNRACIYHQMGQCLAPCIEAVPDDAYRQAADDARRFLRGRGQDLVKELDRRMRDAAAAERFEEAARLRDTAASIQSVLERQRVFAHEQEDRDVVGLEVRGDRACVAILFVRRGHIVGRESYFLSHAADATDGEVVGAFLTQYYGTALAVPRNILVPALPEGHEVVEEWLRERRDGPVHLVVPQRGDKRRLLEMAAKNAELLMAEDHFKRERDHGAGVEDLKRLLKLQRAPRTIDGFDISHHAGDHTVASMVRFQGGRPHKEMYRRYRIRGVVGIDDFASMKEAVRRRFEGLVERGDELPDLVMVDGGRGQLNAAREALNELGLSEQAICSLAKREEEIYMPLLMHPVKTRPDHPGRQLLERVRDEAHRFAIRYQDHLRRGALTKSALLDVPGIGKQRLRELLKRFGSVRGVAAAEVEELRAVPGVTEEMAVAIKRLATEATMDRAD